MKIGILTFHNAINYGAVLQAYALWKFLSLEGHQVEIINYQPKVSSEYYNKEIELFKNSRGRFKVNKSDLYTALKFLKVSSFLKRNARVSGKLLKNREELKQVNGKYDAIICGSDQIWCIDSFRGFDPSYFLDFVDSGFCTKISYAPSFGNTQQFGNRKVDICRLLGDFNALSVRDSNSLALLQGECLLSKVERVLDPTFLLNDYSDVIASPKLGKEFLLIYYQNYLNQTQQSLIQKIASENGLDIVSIGRFYRGADRNVLNSGPGEWLGYFKQASYIVTNTFHGTVFSIIFGKLFTVFPENYNLYKIGDILDILGLSNRAFCDISSEEKTQLSGENFSAINYDLPYRNLSREVSRSKAYLSNALKG